MRVFFLVLFASLASNPILADVHDDKFVARLDKGQNYLYDHKNHELHYIAANGKYLPHRVYLHYDNSIHQWCYLKTDLAGRLPKPLEFLRPDTVTLGRVIGAPLALQKFRLTDEGNWTPTKDVEIYRVWIPGEKPVLKAYVYRHTNPAAKPKTQIPVLRVPTEVPQRSQQ